MSDFLTSLIDRAGNRVPVLERRRLSLFEPAFPGRNEQGAIIPELSRGPRQQESTLEANVEIESAASRLPPLKRRVPRPARRIEPEIDADKTVAAQLNGDSAQSSSRRTRSIQKREDGDNQAETFEAPRPTRPVDAQIDKTVTILRHKASPPPDLSAPRPSRKDTVERGRAFADATLTSLAQPTVNRDRRVALNLAAAPTSPQRPTPRNADIPSGEALKPAPGRSREVVALTRAVRTVPKLDAVRTPVPPPVPPPIHVTIGRIEVRANTAPGTPPRARQPAAPRLSLDDYLRSRNGGAR